jgi:hypothetical protein
MTDPAFSDVPATEAQTPPDVKPSPAVAAPDGFTFERQADGSVHAVPTAATAATLDVSDAPKPAAANAAPEAQFYVHLANGEVKRVKETDLPASGGTNAPYGYWQSGRSVILIIGVYPTEDTV